MSDVELLEAYLDTGRVDYFGELYNRYLPLAYGVCLKYLGSVAAAEDATMEIFETLVPKMERAHVREFRTWLHSVARNHCLQIIRRRKPEATVEPPVVESDDFLHLFDRHDNEAVLAALDKCIEQLPPPQRQSIRLFFLEEKSYADIADATTWQVKSVKSYIQNGKRNLQNCLGKR
jgi:RNA polymerase sigma-70 factor (ECF subfamily)